MTKMTKLQELRLMILFRLAMHFDGWHDIKSRLLMSGALIATSAICGLMAQSFSNQPVAVLAVLLRALPMVILIWLLPYPPAHQGGKR